MSSKEFELTTIRRTALPRSKRLRETPTAGNASGGGGVVVIENGGGVPSAEWHTHTNKAALDQISTDDKGYISLTQLHEMADPDTGKDVYRPVTEKVRAGWADAAGHADTAQVAEEAGVAHDLVEDSPVFRKLLSKLADDAAEGHITFEKGATFLLLAILSDGAHFGNYVPGATGGTIDAAGNAELLSVVVRSLLRSPQFSSGLADGEGFRLWLNEAGLAELELDRLTVRQVMAGLRVYHRSHTSSGRAPCSVGG